MAQTVIGIFDDASEAQTAMQELMEAGFSRNNIDLSTQNSTDTTTSADHRTDDESHREKQGGIMGFFASLFGDDDDDRDRFSTVGERHSIVTVHAQSEDEAERAADILDDAGAIDVNERAEQYRSGSGVGTDSGAMATGAGYGAATGSGMTTGVPADPLSPIYGDTPHITSDSTNFGDGDSTNNDSSINQPAGNDWNSSTGTHQQDMGQQLGMGDRSNRNRSRIFDRSVDETNRLREDRSWNNNESMKRPDADADAENMINTNPGYNRTVDPESDVTNR